MGLSLIGEKRGEQQKVQRPAFEPREPEESPAHAAEFNTEADGWEDATLEELSNSLDDPPIGLLESGSPDAAAQAVHHKDKAQASREEKDIAEQDAAATEGPDRRRMGALHGCWKALMERQMSFGFYNLVLMVLDQAVCPLLTAEEAASLVEFARKKGNFPCLFCSILN